MKKKKKSSGSRNNATGVNKAMSRLEKMQQMKKKKSGKK